MAAVTGKPAIQPIKSLDVRAIAAAMSNARQRIEALEGALTQSSQASGNANGLQAQINALLARIIRLEAAVSSVTALTGLGNGLLVLSNGQFITRVLEGGGHIFIFNPDGSDGNPIITEGGFLGTEHGFLIVTELGEAISVGDAV